MVILLQAVLAVKFSGPLLYNSRTFPGYSRTYAIFQDFPGLEISAFNFRTFQGLYEPWRIIPAVFYIPDALADAKQKCKSTMGKQATDFSF